MADGWKGKRVCFLGDSITEGIGVSVGERYFDRLAEMFGIEAVGMGVNGAQLSGVRKQAERVFNTYGEAVDAIFIFVGKSTCCMFQSCDGNALGVEERRVRELNMSGNTVRGRLDLIMSYLRQNYPTKLVVLMTPVHRAYATFGASNIQYSELYANSLGEFFEDYVQAVRDAADIWSAPLIDLYREGGLSPLTDESAAAFYVNTETDRLHLNPAGHRRIAGIIAGYMRRFEDII